MDDPLASKCHCRLSVRVKHRTEIPHDCARPPAIIRNCVLDYRPNCIHGYGCISFGVLDTESVG